MTFARITEESSFVGLPCEIWQKSKTTYELELTAADEISVVRFRDSAEEVNGITSSTSSSMSQVVEILKLGLASLDDRAQEEA